MRIVLALLVVVAACGDDDSPPDASAADSGSDAGMDALVDARVDFALILPDGADLDAVARMEVVGGEGPYEWQIDGDPLVTAETFVERAFSRPTRVVVRVEDGLGRSATGSFPVTRPVVFRSSHSSSVATWEQSVAVVVPDSGALVVAQLVDREFTNIRRIAVCEHPVGVTPWPLDGSVRWVVACDRDAQVAFVEDERVELLAMPTSSPAEWRSMGSARSLHCRALGRSRRSAHRSS